MRRAIAVAVVVCAVLPAGAAQADPPSYGIVRPDSERGLTLLELGTQLYGGNCATCHGSNGEGVTQKRQILGAGDQLGMGPPLRGVGARAANFYLRTGRMPLASPTTQPGRSRVLLSDHEIRALVAYVASLAPGPPIPVVHPERGNVSEGMQLFTANCAGCHQVVAQGGYVTDVVAPPLEDASPTQIAEAVRIGPYVMPSFPRTLISDRELDSLVAYVQYTKNPQDPGGWAIGNIGPVPEGMVAWFIGTLVLVLTCLVVGRRLRHD